MSGLHSISENGLLRLAVETSLEAARAILAVYDDRQIDVTFKDDHSPLTRADHRSHEVIVGRLGASGLPVLSEEGGIRPYPERARWMRYWLVDPLDGTKEFISRNGEFTVNIALIENTFPRFGVVCAPATGWIYWGRTGEGRAHRASFGPGARGATVMRSGIPLTVAPFARGATSPVRVIASRSHSAPDTEAFILEIERQQGSVQRVSCGSSLKICRVAEGQADIYPRLGPTMEWDTAAAQAVLEAAGGRMVELDAARLAIEYLDTAQTGWKRLQYNKANLLNPSFVAAR